MRRVEFHESKYVVHCLIVFVMIATIGIAIVASFLAPDTPVDAAPPTRPRQMVVLGPLTPVGFHQYDDLDTSCDLTDHGTYVIPTGAHYAFCQAEGQNLRWRDFPRVDGDTTDPTAAIGTRLPAGDCLEYRGRLTHIEFIEEAAGGIMNVTFYGL